MAHAFGSSPDFALGVEEELLLVTGPDRGLSHSSTQVIPAVEVPEGSVVAHDTFDAEIELKSPVCRNSGEALAALRALRRAASDGGATMLGAGIHPAGAFGDVRHVPRERYRAIARSLRGLLLRTPTAALHVHVGMPDPETAIHACNALRVHLPLLQGLTANSPFWHGVDSGLASARSALFRGYPRAEIPRRFESFAQWEEVAGSVVEAAGVEDYTFLWWDIRPHPKLGTVEVRAMDAQSSLPTVIGIAALVQGLAKHEVERGSSDGGRDRREAIAEASFNASRDGIDAVVPWDGAMRPLREVGERALAAARPHARELGSEDALAEVDRLLREGNGADRQRRRFASGGMAAVLEGLVEETAGA